MLKTNLEKIGNNSLLIRTVVEPDICLQHGILDQLPISTKLTEGNFSCELHYKVDPHSSQQIIVTLTDASSIFAVDVIILNAGYNQQMIKKKEKQFIPSTDAQKIVKNEEWWEVVLSMKRSICSKCTHQNWMQIVMRSLPISNAQCHFPSHNLYIHLKSKSMEGQAIILNQIASFLENGALADIQFHINDTILPAHSLIVSGACPVLAAMIFNNFQEESTRIITITDASLEVFKQFLRYLYTGNILDGEKEVMAADLFVLADKYGVESLKEECAVCLVEQLSVMNAVDTLIIAHLHSSTTLYDETISFMSRNASVICSCSRWLRFMKENPLLCFEANQRMMQANCPPNLSCFCDECSIHAEQSDI